MNFLKIQRSGICILIGIFIIGSIGIVSAEQIPVEGGDSFENAMQIEPGSYSDNLSRDDQDFFSITNITPGKKLTVEVEVSAQGSDYPSRRTEITLFDNEKMELNSAQKNVGGDDFESFTVSWTPGSEESSYSFYLKIQENIRLDTEDPYPYLLDISVDDCFDADSQTDAGSTFDTAFEITAGDYDCYFEKQYGDDDKDVYVILMQSNEKLDITVTPPGDAQFEVAIYDEDRTRISKEVSKNKGAIVKNSCNLSSAQDVYIEIKKRFITSDKEYSLSIKAETQEVGETQTTESPDDGSTDDGSTDDGSTDDGSTDDGSTDDGSTDDGSTDDGSTDDESSGGSIPGFEIILALAGLLVVVYLIRRR